MQTMTDSDRERRSKNIRLALVLGAAVILIMLSSVPFWQGLARIAAAE